MTRFAIVKGFNSEREVAAYLPFNYHVVGIHDNDTAVIAGVDVAGWTLEDYVIPRFGSGLMACRELVKAPF